MTITEPGLRPSVREHGHRVTVRAARKRYGSLAALDDLDLDIEPGRFTVLLGPSGSGKSTLLRSIAGIERLDSGTVHLADELVNDRTRSVPPERRNLAMVFQDYALWPHLTARQNIAYALKRRKLTAAAAKTRVDEVLERVGLDAQAEQFPHQLSGGQQQRVALARALVGQPALLLFDEPLSNLDADLRERLRVEISTLTRESGATALYITHDQSEAFALADEVGVLRSGHLEQLGTPEEIYHDPATPFVARFTGLAGSLQGRVVHSTGGLLAVDLGEHTIYTRGAGTSGIQDDVDVLIRPTATALLPIADASKRGAGQHPDAPYSDTIPAVVRDVAYRGRGYEHVVECRYGVLSGVFDTRSWDRGAACSVRIDPTGCLAFPQAE